MPDGRMRRASDYVGVDGILEANVIRGDAFNAKFLQANAMQCQISAERFTASFSQLRNVANVNQSTG